MTSTEAFEELSKEALVQKVKQLQARNDQLQGLLDKAMGRKKNKNEKRDRILDFTRYKMRHIALKFGYLGWDYDGLVIQNDTSSTVMENLLVALEKTKLIQSREMCKMICCGRTDKGVSGFGQVVSLVVRSKVLEGVGIVEESGENIHLRPDLITQTEPTELDFPLLLNRVLPQDIRVLSWTPVTPDFSARFNCKSRTYKYFLPEGVLDILTMRKASEKLIGEHDFRNFCKHQVQDGVVTHVRRINSISIDPLTKRPNGYSVWTVTVNGSAFLYHQIRCLVSVLILIGQGREAPEIIDQLLDIDANPGKPQYRMASELPLLFYHAEYENVSWNTSSAAYEFVIKSLQEQWTKQEIKSTMVRTMLDSLEAPEVAALHSVGELRHQVDCILPEVRVRSYKEILRRQREETIEEKVDKLEEKKKKKRLMEEDMDSEIVQEADSY